MYYMIVSFKFLDVVQRCRGIISKFLWYWHTAQKRLPKVRGKEHFVKMDKLKYHSGPTYFERFTPNRDSPKVTSSQLAVCKTLCSCSSYYTRTTKQLIKNLISELNRICQLGQLGDSAVAEHTFQEDNTRNFYSVWCDRCLINHIKLLPKTTPQSHRDWKQQNNFNKNDKGLRLKKISRSQIDTQQGAESNKPQAKPTSMCHEWEFGSVSETSPSLAVNTTNFPVDVSTSDDNVPGDSVPWWCKSSVLSSRVSEQSRCGTTAMTLRTVFSRNIPKFEGRRIAPSSPF